MKRTFEKEYILSNRGCYKRERVNNLPFINNKRITLKNLFDYLPIKDFVWFLIRKCDLTVNQQQLFALHCAKQVEGIFNENYPEDKRVSECIEATELFLKGGISRDDLIKKRRAAYAAYAAADSAYAAAAYVADAAYAAYAAADAADADAAYAADAADAAYADAAAAADAAYADAAAAAAAASYRKSIWEFCKTLK